MNRRLSPIWRSVIRCIRTRSTPGKKQLQEQAARAFDPKVGQEAEAQAEREIERLHAKIGRLTIENDFFAKRFGR